MSVFDLPDILQKLVLLIPQTLPFLKMSTCVIENGKTGNKFEGLSVEYKDGRETPPDFCSGLSIGLDEDQFIIVIHIVGRKDVVMKKPVNKVTPEDLLALLHQAFIPPEEVS